MGRALLHEISPFGQNSILHFYPLIDSNCGLVVAVVSFFHSARSPQSKRCDKIHIQQDVHVPISHYFHCRDWYMGHFHFARAETEAIFPGVIIKSLEPPIALSLIILRWCRAPVGAAEATYSCIPFPSAVGV